MPTTITQEIAAEEIRAGDLLFRGNRTEPVRVTSRRTSDRSDNVIVGLEGRATPLSLEPDAAVHVERVVLTAADKRIDSLRRVIDQLDHYLVGAVRSVRQGEAHLREGDPLNWDWFGKYTEGRLMVARIDRVLGEVSGLPERHLIDPYLPVHERITREATDEAIQALVEVGISMRADVLRFRPNASTNAMANHIDTVENEIRRKLSGVILGELAQYATDHDLARMARGVW